MKKIYLILLIVLISFSCSKKQRNEVVIYVSEDQVFSEPILKDFENETGIKVKAVFDPEETKGAGVMNRLISEKDNPQADVYWSNEPLRAELLKNLGILDKYISPNSIDIPNNFKDSEGYWTGFSARARIFIINKKTQIRPNSINDYTKSDFKGKCVIANPLFGTTTVTIASLYVIWGDEKAKKFLDDMKKNEVKISTSNGESADFVASGEYDFSLVDSDDGINRIRQGKNVEVVYPDNSNEGIGTLLLPNCAMVIKGTKNIENAKKLVDYLLSKETEKKLAFADCAQIPLHKDVQIPVEVPKIDKIKFMQINYSTLASKLNEIQPYIKSWVGY